MSLTRDVDVAVSKLIKRAAGVSRPVLALACQWWAKSDRQGTRQHLVGVGSSFGPAFGLNQVISRRVDRIRPYASGISDLLIAPRLHPSFPSDPGKRRCRHI